MYGLRATRIYHDKPLPEDVLTRILQSGTRACSAGNTQPWELVLVPDVAIKRQLKTMMEKAYIESDAQRSQTGEQLVVKAARSVAGHVAVDNMDRVADIVLVFWSPDRG